MTYNKITVGEDGKLTVEQIAELNEGETKTYLDITALDPIVAHTILELATRSRLGLEKYGTTVYQNSKDDFLQHAKEEALDLANYLTKLQYQKSQQKRPE